ncbi:hypothetical protein A2U01_0005214, partial [Trifolium medium]|nr:hypothetical protein [Trifolium medium]
ANPRTNRLPTRYRKDLKKAKLEQKALKRFLRESGVYSILTEKLLCANRENLLPVYSKDSDSAHKVLTFKAFLASALHVPTQQRIGMLVFLFSLLQYITQNSTNTPPFESQSDVLSFGEAISALTPQIAHTTLFIISYIMSWTLVLPLNPGLLIFLGVILIFAPFILLPYLVRNSSASGIHVACRGFNLSVIGFTGVVTFAFCLFFAAVVLTVLYVIWCFMYRMTPASSQDSEVTEDLSSLMLEELNANDSV